MFEYAYNMFIEVWFDQFQEKMFGTFFPKFSMLAECVNDFGNLEFFDFDSLDELESFGKC